MPALYRGAEAFVLPSFYEGFGLPILEAFACKIPVLCSAASSLKEDLIKRGTERLKIFSWKKSAEKILELFKNADRN